MLGAMLENPENRETDSEITRGENPYEHARELYNYNKSMRELPAAGNSPPKSSRKKLTTVKAEKLFREGKAVDDVAQIIGISAVNARTIKSRMRPKS